MAIIEPDVVVAVFENRTQADKAIDDLRAAGFRHEQMGLAVRAGDVTQPMEAADETEAAAGGAVVGAVGGGTLGAALGALATGLIPGVGPVIAGGLLAGILAGAVVGATAGGLAGGLVGLGLSLEEARFYEEQFRAGHTIVTVRAADRTEEADAILRRHGAYDASTARAASR